jgi:hypothetical protein
MTLLALAGCGAEPRVEDLRKLARPDKPNNYLICAPGLCAAAADEPGPLVDATPEKVLVAALSVAAREANVSPGDADAEVAQLVFVQRSAVFRFPDIVMIQAIPAPDGRTAIALYSHSVYGHYDFGVNKARARRWMAAIQAELKRG